MTNAFIISEYIWKGHKQLLLERLQGDTTGYRVTIVLRCNSLNAAKEAFLQEIPADRKDYHSKVIEDYAMRHSIKSTPEKKRPAPVHLQKGRQNDKSKRKRA